jgi:alpha-mannosidase
MEYSRIVAVTGMPGLYEILSSKSDGAIVRSLDDGSTKFVSSRVHNLSHLESIEIYTTGENVSLADVFTAMKASNEALPDVKDNKALRAYFEKVYPEMDFDRVYTSDMKKMVNWSAALEKHNVDFTPAELPEEETEPVAETAPAQEEEKKATKKSRKKNVAETLEDAGEKIVMDVSPDEVPEVAKTKTTRSRKKKSEE